MRSRRIKAPPGELGLYHCTSRIVGGQFLLKDEEKEYFTQRMWEVATFCGVKILTNTVMSNHYHQFVEVPGEIKYSDQELLARLYEYYGPDHREYKILERGLNIGGEWADLVKGKFLRRMGDISVFQQILKETFSNWYNTKYDRKGTLWAGRFDAVLVEDTSSARLAVASYIELNSVRAEMCQDPKDYRFCGFAAAMAGDTRARTGLMRVMGRKNWEETYTAYRKQFLIKGGAKVPRKRGFIDREHLKKELARNGRLSQAELLRLQITFFTRGLVLGRENYVEEAFKRYRPNFGKNRQHGACNIEGGAWRDFRILNQIRDGHFN